MNILENLIQNQVEATILKENDEVVLNQHRIITSSEWNPSYTDEPTFSYLPNFQFKDGIIDVDVKSVFLKDAPEYARGFIGVAFRISSDLSHYESFYIRPSNGECDDQFRRNHSTQYYSYPNHKWFVLRENEPKKYESYADIAMNEWIHLKIEVKGSRALLFINHAKNPSLIVNDLKLGKDQEGSIGLWTEIGTDAYYKNLKITHF